RALEDHFHRHRGGQVTRGIAAHAIGEDAEHAAVAIVDTVTANGIAIFVQRSHGAHIGSTCHIQSHGREYTVLEFGTRRRRRRWRRQWRNGSRIASASGPLAPMPLGLSPAAITPPPTMRAWSSGPN